MKTLLKRSIQLVVVLLCCAQPLQAQTVPTVAFELSSSAHYESYSPTIPVTVILSSPTSNTVYVDYSVTGGTATGGAVDYYLPSGSLTFSPGETTKNIIIYMVHDLYGEANETIIISLSNPTGATLGSPSSHTYTIGNDDWYLFGFNQSGSSGWESEHTVNLTVGYYRGWYGGSDASVNYQVIGGTATGGGVDYTLDSGTLKIPLGQDTNDIIITINDDSISEDNETIIIKLIGDPNTIGLNSTYIYTILDNDDEKAPSISEYYPEPNSIQVPRDTYIKLGITDNYSGVDVNTVQILVEENLVYDGSLAEPNGTYKTSFGTCIRTGTEAEYVFVFRPSTWFDFEQEVNVLVYAKDKYNNTMPKQSYSFYIVMRTFGGNLKVNTGSDSFSQDHPATAADSSGNIWVVWDHSPSAYDSGIYIGKLEAGKNSFEQSTVICDDPGIQSNPVIAIDSNDTLYVAWQDQSAIGNKWSIYVSKSSDGTTWSPPVVVSYSETSNIYNQTLPAIAIDHAEIDVIYIACEDDSEGNKDIWLSSSTDGTTWTPKRITTNTMDQTDPTIVVNDHVVYIGWTDARNESTDFYGIKSSSSWTNIPVVITGSNQSGITYAADSINNVVHEFWVDDVSGDYDILYRKTGMTGSVSNGISVTDEPVAGKNQPAAGVAVIDESPVPFVAWRDWRNVLSNNDTDIYYTEKTSSGFSTNILINDDTGTSPQTNPAVGVDGLGNPYIVWTDQRNGNNDIYYCGVSSLEEPLPMVYVDNYTSIIIQISGHMELTIPTGAMPSGFSTSDISVSKVINPPKLPDGCFGICYDIRPSGITFNTPVTITIVHNEDDCPNLNSYQVYWYNNETDTWSQDGISEVQHYEIAGGLHAVVCKSTHFTSFVVGSSGTSNPDYVDVGGSDSGSGGCAMSPYAQSSDGAMGYFLEYLVYLVILFTISRIYKRKRINEVN